MKRSVRYSTLTAALVASSMAHAAGLPNYDASYDQKAAMPAIAAHGRSSVTLRSAVASTDPVRGVPRFMWAPASHPVPKLAAPGPEAAARAYLAQYARLYNLPLRALETAVVTQIHDIGRGAIVISLRQNVDGVEVFHNDIKVVMRQNRELVAISGNLHPSAIKGLKRGATFKVAAPEALTWAVRDLYGISFRPSDMIDRREAKAGTLDFDLAPTPVVKGTGLHFSRPARLHKVLFPLPDRLVAAYYIEVRAGKADNADTDAYAYVIAADDGRVLYRENQTHSAFTYRVWAEADGEHVPLDGPQADFTPHPTGEPDGSSPPFIAPTSITIDGFNTNPNGGADPWLPMGATQTTGNNVDAYADLKAPDGFSDGDIRATTTSAATFDRTYDTLLDPASSSDQVMAAVTQLFYVTNWLHDWYYDSGFNEAAGNAQAHNLGRGGIEGDPLLAEAQDSSGTNNANMDAASDGTSPRMQMYVWKGPGVETHSLEVESSNQTLNSGIADFGPQSFTVSGELALANDATAPAPATDGCEAMDSSVAGKIALIDRGSCDDPVKAANAQAAGALGVILANNEGGDAPPIFGEGPSITVPVLSVSQADGEALKAALLNGTVTVSLSRKPPVKRDGTIDNTIIAHEWGHYLHLRQVACGSSQCGAQSEGWGDFIALMMVLREGDDVHGAFPLAIYATSAFDDAYFGIRRVPYSIDFGKNALTLRHISNGEPLPDTHPVNGSGDNAEAHNAGEIWATSLFEAYAALIESSPGGNRAHTFAEAKRLMSDYIVAGMKIAPANPTFTEMRDAILAAAAANDTNDLLAMAEAFARRGSGTCAVSPPVDSTDLTGVVEDFEIRPNAAFVSADLDDSLDSCDNDGVLDGQETGKVTLTIQNTGPKPLADAQATVTTPTSGVQFPNGTQFTFGTIPPFAMGTASFQVGLNKSFTQIGSLQLDLAITSPSSCVPTQTQVTIRRVNTDEIPMSSTTDNVESDHPLWEATGDSADLIWAREQVDVFQHHWHGIDYGSLSDTSIESPPLNVGSQDFVLSFKHRYQFEFSENENWDGAVIEVSQDGGASWVDITTFGDPGYGGVIGNQANNPLSDREGYVKRNPSWPSTDTTSIHLGTALAGKTVKVRFRIGTDEAAGEFGWEIDDIGFQGITNTPFAIVTSDSAACSETRVPDADSGSDDDGCGCAVVGGSDGAPRSPFLWMAPLASLAVAAMLRRRWRRTA